jgi:chloride channel, nucleotide-sensitive, 1A
VRTRLIHALALCINFTSTVDPIFEALSYCASLHPDPQGSDDGDADDDDDDDDALINPDTTPFEVFTGDEGEELSEVGRVRSAPTNDTRYQPY